MSDKYIGEHVSIREVYALIEESKREFNNKLDAMRTDQREQIDNLSKQIMDAMENQSTRSSVLFEEIYGKGGDKGLRTEVSDLKRNTSIAHIFQLAISAMIAAWLGKQP